MRFTDRARRPVVQAQEEAKRLEHNYIGPEHLLLALTHESIGGVAAKTLEALEVDLATVRERVEAMIGRGGMESSGHMPFVPEAKKALEMSLREAVKLGHQYIGTEHLLLGLIRAGDDVAAGVLTELGVDLDRAREQATRLLDEYQHQGKQAK